MAKDIFPESQLPVRKTKELLPDIFKTDANDKFLAGVVDPLVQPGTLDKKVGYIGRRYGKTFKTDDVYLDTDNTLRSRYQLEPGVIVRNDVEIEDFYDYLDFKNQLKFFGNQKDRDDLITDQEHYTWNPPIDWDKFINYREYFWIPQGPPAVKVVGQAQNIISSYRVMSGAQSSYIFSPDGLTNNPTLTLYRGQKYRFVVNTPGNRLAIRKNLDTGILVYNPITPYSKGQIVLYDNFLWEAQDSIPPSAPGTPLDSSIDKWKKLETSEDQKSAFDYDQGVTNNRTENGTITFEVPLDSPDILFYQSLTDPDKFGKFIISNVESNTLLDIEKDILGKRDYLSSNGIQFTNGLIVRFEGEIIPNTFASDSWLVEGVGEKITLTRFSDLSVSTKLTKNAPEILFDDSGFDTQPFDDASAYPAVKDYLTISKSSIDSNPWSRYNRWFHRSVLTYAHGINNSSFDAPEQSRAKRPIIEFNANLQLFNYGSVAKAKVDYIDDFTDDAFSIVEGSLGYNVDGEDLFDGARILFTADTDSLANNKIYRVKFLIHNGRRQISLIPAEDAESSPGDAVLVVRGKSNQGLMYHFTGAAWVKSQEKTATNQAPLFDVFDEDGVSLSDPEKYPVSTFIGSKIISYRPGSGRVDTELGFKISYLNIDNAGDILFDFNFETEEFIYQIDRINFSKRLNSAFYRFNPGNIFLNSWVKLDQQYAQPIIDTAVADGSNIVLTDSIDWQNTKEEQIKKIVVYVNGSKTDVGFTREDNRFIFDKSFARGTAVSFKIYGDVEPKNGYYEFPIGMERNPLNDDINTFTLGQASDHVLSAIDIADAFNGKFPGDSNLRDISDYQAYSRRFVKHTGLSPLAVLLLCDKEINVVKSIQHSKKAYTDFKNNFIRVAETLFIDQEPVDYVDTVLEEMTRTQTAMSPFSGSDMVGSGAYTSLEYVVEDEGIKTFALSEKFDLDTLSSRAIYIYQNNQQLIHGRDYEFDSTFGFVRLKINLVEGDSLVIREYISTGNNYIPSTPTKLGLYKKYLPKKFVDDTYVEPREVIQGHDGSITLAYGDYRDDVLLELELRIYNNIKQKYDETVFDIDSVLGGYYGNAIYNKKDLDSIVSKDFLSWLSGTNIDYVNNSYLDTENSFTYTYSNMANQEGTVNLPGYWRGVYRWFYDTDRPHRCPWEMLGFSEQPIWWENRYGPAPYTSGNLILWEDIRDGIIREGYRAGVYDRYKRPTILGHLPVDGDGNLLSPLDSGLASNFTLINNKGKFNLGDVAPAEYAWRSSSEWPYSILAALCILKPFEFVTDNFVKSSVVVNKLGQTVDNKTDVFRTLADLTKDNFDQVNLSGLFVYILNYLKSTSAPIIILTEKIKKLDVRLTSRMSGFVDQTQQKFILDSKSPQSKSSSIFIPVENYDIIFNVSAPISSVTYSGVILEKVDTGWTVGGYDPLSPFFNYFEAVASQSDPLITVGGVSENFLNWDSDKFYGNGVLVKFGQDFYRSLRSHTSTDVFDTALWKRLATVPIVGGTAAFKRRTFNKLRTKTLVYGEILTSIQEVVDFLLGYEEYLRSIGLSFDGYDPNQLTGKDWLTAVKEFMFWTKHNWAVGSILTLSPVAENIEFALSIGVADNLLDSFYGYQVLKSDGLPLKPEFINVKRDFQSFSISTTNTNEGIYFLKVYLVLKEHVAVFNDRTVFNDVLYDKPTGYRQERIRSRGFRTVDWDGDYTSPGFLFDNVDIQVWQPFVDYKLGDIVSYKSFYWTSQENQLGSEDFDDKRWSKLDVIPEKGLVANFDFKINQFEDYYETDADGIGSSQRDLARHLIGYQPREYLQEIAEDQVSQFRIYQGFIREKGTANSIIKIFDKVSEVDDDRVVLNEEWAFQAATFGGVDQVKQFEFYVDKSDFELNPQPILITIGDQQSTTPDQFIRVSADKFTLAPIPFTTEINSVSEYDEVTRSAGYVNRNHVDFIFKNREDLLDLDINLVNENSQIWITFDKNSWTVLRYNEPSSIGIRLTEVINEKEKIVRLYLNNIHTISVDDIVGIRSIENLEGFYKVIDRKNTTIDVKFNDKAPNLVDSTLASIGILTPARLSNYSAADTRQVALLRTGSRLWIDDDGNAKWKVVEKTKQYQTVELTNYGITDPRKLGTSVLYVENLRQVVASAPETGFVMVYSENQNSFGVRQIISPPSGFETALSGEFGNVLAISPDYKFLVIGSPYASGVRSRFLGNLNNSITYLEEELVLYQNKLWRAVEDVFAGDGSSIDFDNQQWQPATIVEANVNGRGLGFFEQGMISVYRFADDRWENTVNIVSPRQKDSEYFGSDVSIGVSGNKYYMAVSAVGANDGKGKVYLYVYENNSWKHLENPNYAGIYSDDPTVSYPPGIVVWDDGLWESTTANFGGGTAPSLATSGWILLDSNSTQSSLPSNVAVDNDDGSTLLSGLLTPDQLAEAVKEGDQFGFETTMNRTGSILIVGTPDADDEFFANYRGFWKEFQEYRSGDVVKYNSSYYRLTPINSPDDSVTTSRGEFPDQGIPWIEITAVPDTKITGKIYIYQRVNDFYKLIQIITGQNISSYSDLPISEIFKQGDKFGYSVDLDDSGMTLAVSAPQSNVLQQTQGVVYVFKTNSLENIEFRLKQKLQSYENYNNEFFGSKVIISRNSEKIVVGAKNAPYRIPIYFEPGTAFDRTKTTFSENQGFPGQVYVFENKDQGYLLTEKLEANFVRDESFGETIDCTDSLILVGSPNYKQDGNAIGKIRTFRKTPNTSSLKVLARQEKLVNINLLKNIELYDETSNTKLRDLDIVDNFKLKILGIAEQEIKFKTVYDPATYENGNDDVVIDKDQAWFEKHVGELWWDLSSVKFIQYEQGDEAYKIGNWNAQAVGSTIDVYEWVESVLRPSEWSILADTVEGLAEGISGQPKFADDTVYNIKIIFNSNTGEEVGTRYYYWVKNKTTLPSFDTGRKLAASTVADLINNPAGSGLPFISIFDTSKFLAYNLRDVLTSDRCLLNFEYAKKPQEINQTHREYQLLSEGVSTSLPNNDLERKWLDSLIGFDESGNSVPDPRLSVKQRYGINFRPRQTMFVDRSKALEIIFDRVNQILLSRPFVDLININTLINVDPPPDKELNEYDFEVEDYVDLLQVGTVRVKKAVLRANIIDGKIDTIDIIDPGFGYRIPPPIEIEGTGNSAAAEVTIDINGRINSVKITNRGVKYTFVNIKVREFSVLVNSDSTAAGKWSIYSWDQQRKIFYRTRSQGFDTTRYYNFIDWWKVGYDENSRIVTEITSLYEEPTITPAVNDLIRIKEYADGGWAVLERTKDGEGELLENYTLVGRKNGTIKISKSLYDYTSAGIGFDYVSSYDAELYDLQPIRELRIILKTIKENILLEDLRVEWNNLFFSSIKYAFSEQPYIDWAFKTSFLNAIHNIGELKQKFNYTSDNLESYQKYINEVKPFRTTIREYTSKYNKIESTNSAITDFDLPASYSARERKILPIGPANDRTDEYPWKWWTDNNGYSIVDILVSDPGENYTTPPSVLIQGNGSGAAARAYITNQRVSAVQIINQGSGYTKTPKIFLVGGNGTSSKIAQAVAILGNQKIRTFDVTVKFDRISKTGIYQNFSQTQTFVATGVTSVFDLNYPITRDKNKIRIIKNNEVLLNSDYVITLYETYNDEYTVLKGRVIFNSAPQSGDIIEINYDKNDRIFDSVNRINKYYSPTAGMKGNDLPQLMTGVDFGGVQVQGTTFDVTGGWDALPWYTDNWDSVESSSDYYYVADGSTNFISLPFVPAIGEIITIYLQRTGESRPTRIDDLYYDLYDGSTVQPNGRTEAPKNARIPTFIGDGSRQTVWLQSEETDEFYITVFAGDTLIFRKVDSDGSVTITDINLLDTKISGGNFSSQDYENIKTSSNTVKGAYSSATGLTPEEIIISGDKFISPDQVPAPEENVPGQVLDSLSVKVFTRNTGGSIPIQSKTILGNGVTRTYPIGLRIVESKSVIVYVDKIKQEYNVDYEIDFIENNIIFNEPVTINKAIEIIALGLAGVGILDYREFLSDGETRFFLTNAQYDQAVSAAVTVNGIKQPVGILNSADQTETANKSLIEFGIPPILNSVIKIVILGLYDKNIYTELPLVSVNQQLIAYDGSTQNFELDNFVDLSRSSSLSSLLIEINGTYQQGVDTTYVVYDGTNNEIVVGIDPNEAIGVITSGFLKVFINNVLQRFVFDYVYNGNENLIIVSAVNLKQGDIIKIENSLRSKYTINDNILIFSSDIYQTLSINDVITITWFEEYPLLDLISDEYSGGKVQYQLPRIPLSIEYVWVYKNGRRLTQDIDYSISLPRGVVYLTENTVQEDLIKIVSFGNNVYQDSRAYEIFKDMLNVYHYKRHARDKKIQLTKDLNYYDSEIEISNGDLLSSPIAERKIPGVVIINEERIEYFAKNGNILSQLRRGSLGTAVKETNLAGSTVIDAGVTESLPYSESQERIDFVAPNKLTLIPDGTSRTFELDIGGAPLNQIYVGFGNRNNIIVKINSTIVDRDLYSVSIEGIQGILTFDNSVNLTEEDRVEITPLLVGPLDFVPAKSIRSGLWFRSSIPVDSGPCDQIEMFLSGKRLRKDPIDIYDENNGIDSPVADKQHEAEFSVDGISNYIRVTNELVPGSRISVIRKQGKIWYEKGRNTASKGATLLENATPVAKFILQKGTELPE